MTTTAIACPFCLTGIAGSRLCPKTREICDWCCPRCAAIRCARGIVLTFWPAAERVAREMAVAGHSLADALAAWAVAFRDRVRIEPEPAMRAAAERVLEQRLEFGQLPPPPASVSQTGMRLPELLVGLPGKRPARTE